MKKTNFDRYLDEQLRDPVFAARFDRAGMRMAESAAMYRVKRTFRRRARP